MLLPLPARALDTKTCGKLGMVAILGTAAIIVKVLINREHKAVINLHESLGPPDRFLEFQQGFDHWRIEWYGDSFYVFRNGFIY